MKSAFIGGLFYVASFGLGVNYLVQTSSANQEFFSRIDSHKERIVQLQGQLPNYNKALVMLNNSLYKETTGDSLGSTDRHHDVLMNIKRRKEEISSLEETIASVDYPKGLNYWLLGSTIAFLSGYFLRRDD